MKKRWIIAVMILFVLMGMADAQEILLPDPVNTGKPLELCLNSRYSEHGGWSGEAPDQWLSNVLWATGRAPITGSYRDIYVTKFDGRYLYNPYNNSLIHKSSGNSSPAAFYLSFDRELDFDAGVAYMFALLSSVSLWNGTESQLASCPMQTILYFGIKDVEGLNSNLVVSSSDGSLPNPSTTSSNDFQDIIVNLNYTDKFKDNEISIEELSQILWAGYGCTPHVTYNGRAGLTVPSWCAAYFLTGHIYVVKDDGVFRYHNRLPSGSFATRDHRIEKINSTDVRRDLQAIAHLPSAPEYIIIGLSSDDVDKWYARLETGFAAGNMLLQASALGLGCYFNTNLTPQEQSNIQNITGIPYDDIPWAIVSLGHVNPVRVEIEDGIVQENMSVEVNITAFNVTDLSNFDITIKYDPSVVITTDLTVNPAFGTAQYNFENSSEGWVSFATLNNRNGQNGDVWLGKVTLKAKGNYGDSSNLNLSVNRFVSSLGVNISFKVNNGVFRIIPEGDINLDGELSLEDAIYLGKHVIGLSGYENVSTLEGDVNCDGKVDLVDAIYLGKHVIGLSGYETLYPCLS